MLPGLLINSEKTKMASESLKSTVNAVVPLNGKNYPTWKVQCRMALMKEGLWNIVDGTEAAPGPENGTRSSSHEEIERWR